MNFKVTAAFDLRQASSFRGASNQLQVIAPNPPVPDILTVSIKQFVFLYVTFGGDINWIALSNANKASKTSFPFILLRSDSIFLFILDHWIK